MNPFPKVIDIAGFSAILSNDEPTLPKWVHFLNPLGSSFDCINFRLNGDIVLQLLSYVAQTEREFILQRQAEGIAAAKQRGVHFGRKPMERPARFSSVVREWEAGELSAREAAHILQISHTTFLRWAKSTQH